MNRCEMSVQNHKKGCNCAQAVACVFADKLGYSEDEIFRLTEAFGGGMGGGGFPNMPGSDSKGMTPGERSSGGRGGALSTSQREALRCWNDSNPDMKMTEKEFLERR